MKRLLAILLLATSAFATTTITGSVRNLATAPITKGSFVRFWLRGCSGNQPRVTGVGVLAPTLGAVWYQDFPVDANGNISGTIYSTRDATGTGNGDIECGGSYTAVWFGMQAFLGGKGGPEIPIHAKSGGTLDVSNVTPITVNPVVTAPTGDSTYLRLDAGNSPVTGPITFNAAVTDNSNHTVTGSANLNGGGNLSGTFTGNPTLSGNPSVSGTSTFSGPVNVTAGGSLAGTFTGNWTPSGNITFQGTNTHSGSETFSGALNLNGNGVSTYRSITTAGGGVPAVLGLYKSILAETANISPQTLYTTAAGVNYGAAGFYRVCFAAETINAGTGTTSTVTVGWTGAGGAKTFTSATWALNSNTLSGQVNGCLVFFSAASQAITVGTASGTYGTSTYRLDATVEELR